jgi:hypothetical protein
VTERGVRFQSAERGPFSIGIDSAVIGCELVRSLNPEAKSVPYQLTRLEARPDHGAIVGSEPSRERTG